MDWNMLGYIISPFLAIIFIAALMILACMAGDYFGGKK